VDEPQEITSDKTFLTDTKFCQNILITDQVNEGITARLARIPNEYPQILIGDANVIETVHIETKKLDFNIDDSTMTARVQGEEGAPIIFTGIKTPEGSNDAANKKYVDDAVAGIDLSNLQPKHKINNANATSSTTIYAPTAAGTAGQFLTSNGTGNVPSWVSPVQVQMLKLNWEYDPFKPVAWISSSNIYLPMFQVPDTTNKFIGQQTLVFKTYDISFSGEKTLAYIRTADIKMLNNGDAYNLTTSAGPSVGRFTVTTSGTSSSTLKFKANSDIPANQYIVCHLCLETTIT
jgi:hypothetical protein